MAAEHITAALEAESLTCERGGRRLFTNVSFALSPGEVLVLRGPNGSGKSSLLRVLSGLLPPTQRRVLWQGKDTADEPAPWRGSLAFLGHGHGIKSALTVEENLRFWARFEGADVAPREALAAVGMDSLAHLPAAMLSAGQQRRLGLARLAARPGGCWLMDEPTVTLDAAAIDRLFEMVRGHRATGGIVVMATHDDIALEEASILTLGHAA